MTDKEVLFDYRLKEAEETRAEAEEMLKGAFSSRAIVNRAYYAMFYALHALFLKTGIRIKTSKHKGLMSEFDRVFVKTGKIDKRYSTMLHSTFNLRQEGDYKDLIQIPREEAEQAVLNARGISRCNQAVHLFAKLTRPRRDAVFRAPVIQLCSPDTGFLTFTLHLY